MTCIHFFLISTVQFVPTFTLRLIPIQTTETTTGSTNTQPGTVAPINFAAQLASSLSTVTVENAVVAVNTTAIEAAQVQEVIITEPPRTTISTTTTTESVWDATIVLQCINVLYAAISDSDFVNTMSTANPDALTYIENEYLKSYYKYIKTMVKKYS